MSMVTIIIPTYNPKAELLKRSVASLTEQTYRDIEILIVDDGSDGAYQKVIDAAGRGDNRIHVIHRPRGGVSEARNAGVMAASGEYIGFLDDDDVYLPCFVEEALEIALQEDCDYVSGGVKKITSDPAQEMNYSNAKVQNTVIRVGELDRYIIAHLPGNPIKTQGESYISYGPIAKLIKKEILRQTAFPSGVIWGEDQLWNVAVMKLCRKVVLADRKWYLYIMNHESVSWRYTQNALEQTGEVALKMRQVTGIDEEKDIKAYGDYILVLLKEACRRSISHPDCALNTMEKRKMMLELRKKDPWNVLLRNDYCHLTTQKRQIQCLAFRWGWLQTIVYLQTFGILAR